jgi:hypothetical protein
MNSPRWVPCIELYEATGADRLDADVTRDTLSVLLKYQQDVEKVQRELVVNEA